jgi:pSer/pThr/pTyr-binding forkhead associated (FHA) protein
MHKVYLRDLVTDRASGSAGHSLAITHFPHVMGRHPNCDGQFGAPWVSRRHCRFFLAGNEIWVEDLGSLNGTILNGEQLHCPRPVHDGDRLELAGIVFQVLVGRR